MLRCTARLRRRRRQAGTPCAERLQVGMKGAVHVTGGGFDENIPRVLPSGTGARIDRSAWQVPPVFQWLQEAGVSPCNLRQEALSMRCALPQSRSALALLCCAYVCADLPRTG